MAWLLPEHIEDVLPAEARAIERLRRGVLDLFGARLRAGGAAAARVRGVAALGHRPRPRPATFKLVDQLSGRMMGVRADITPQVARIDAHLLNRQGVARLCYCGSVLHTCPRA